MVARLHNVKHVLREERISMPRYCSTYFRHWFLVDITSHFLELLPATLKVTRMFVK